MDTVRVRFAPSPTGFLHVGGARTALFNWLLARQKHGVFVLRIEDTDMARSTEASLEGILEGMRFLGMDWDEGPDKGGDFGPYFQSQRLHLYKEYADQLLQSERAYECFCTSEELNAMREEARAEKRDPKYDGRCRHLSADEREAKRAAGLTSVLRFATDYDGQTTVDDRIRGLVAFDNRQLDDFVIFKTDGMPTYNFAVVVDDALMQISHVIRGEDHLSNTPKQIQIYEALGFAVPQFAHIPMILGPDKTRLSKRHGATSVTQFRDEGYLQEAMVNYLALLGWGYDDSQTVFAPSELIEKFALERVSKNPAVFDLKKLEWLNGVYLRDLDLPTLTAAALPFFQRAGLVDESPTTEQTARVERVLETLQPRLKRLDEIEVSASYFFQDVVEYEEKAARKGLLKGSAQEILTFLAKHLNTVSTFDEPTLKPVFAAAMEQFDCKLGDVMQPVRVAVTGTNSSPSMYEVLPILGREVTVQRIQNAVTFITVKQEEES